MMNYFFLSVLTSPVLLSASATDYFPVQVGNAWTFSYTSTSMPVILNPPTTRDSGTVKWKVVRIQGRDDPLFVEVLQTRSLAHRVITGGIAGNLDSTFSPPHVTVDSIFITESGFMLHDWAGLFFYDDSCAFAVRDPTGPMPSGLSSKDTAVSFQGTNIAGKKMIASECSCIKSWHLFSFTLGPDIGPVEAKITLCPNMGGSTYQETWKLVSREYPTSVLKRNAETAALKTFVYSQSAGRISCSLRLGYSSRVRIDLLDLQGRLIKALFKGNLNTGEFRYSWNMPANASGITMLRVRTEAEDHCVKIATGVK